MILEPSSLSGSLFLYLMYFRNNIKLLLRAMIACVRRWKTLWEARVHHFAAEIINCYRKFSTGCFFSHTPRLWGYHPASSFLVHYDLNCHLLFFYCPLCCFLVVFFFFLFTIIHCIILVLFPYLGVKWLKKKRSCKRCQNTVKTGKWGLEWAWDLIGV